MPRDEVAAQEDYIWLDSFEPLTPVIDEVLKDKARFQELLQDASLGIPTGELALHYGRRMTPALERQFPCHVPSMRMGRKSISKRRRAHR
jgi:hypothetical protein